MKSAQLEKILKAHDYQRANVLAILQDIQASENYLPRKTLEEVAQKLQIPVAQLYYLATFYRAFSLHPRGRHLVTVCTGTACHVKGAASILNTLERELKVQPGETTGDKEYTLETVNCLGSCALAPLAVIDGHYHGRMLGSTVLSLLGGEKDASKKS
jgi:NADH:ubiquinone oxidoreductase subunit E